MTTPQMDLLAIPAPLQALNWRRVTGRETWYDGEQVLFAVPICERAEDPNGPWGYQLDLVTIFIDDSGANGRPPITEYMVDGNHWGFEPGDAAYFVVVVP